MNKKKIFSTGFGLAFVAILLNSCVSKAGGGTAPEGTNDGMPDAIAVMYILNDSETGMGHVVGEVSLTVTSEGLALHPTFTKKIADGEHGFHIHEGMSVAPAKNDAGDMVVGLSAKGHYDPGKTGKHEGPDGDGHLGDLPLLEIKDGMPVESELLARRIESLDDIYGRVLMIHVHGDNYSDDPKKLGGGGPRYIAGIIERVAN
ncbi:superoxide dismutase family protein [Candidatus Haliotispira prima]|uniref:Superoxide dismutase family protein n=1 Tax=Candidatus Haliotispira prima TaxID=3034016 RepID=A0ABY8MI50_9SPIO|nr:superoxide dismutase family protein [Candidatus Haliotispira prima]